MSVWPFPLYEFCKGDQRLIKCGDWNLSWIQKFDSSSLDIHAMLDHSRSGILFIEQRKKFTLRWWVLYLRLHGGMISSPCNGISTGEFCFQMWQCMLYPSVCLCYGLI